MSYVVLLFCAAFFLAACGRTPTLNVYCWSGTMDPAVLEDFEKLHHCKVAVEHFASNEELFAKLKNISTKRQIYDVLFPSDYMVSILISENLLEELPAKEKIPNWKHLDPVYTDLYFDRGNRYSAPYQFGMTGLAWDSQKINIAENTLSWQILTKTEWKRKTSVLNDSREVFGVALRMLGRSVNEKDPQWLEKAAAKLREIKNIAAAINSENFEYLLLNGDISIAHAWNTNILKIKTQKPSLRFSIPKEGGVIWMDNLAIAKGAKHKDLAAAFINFFLDPEIAKRNAVASMEGTPNRTARAQLAPELQNNPALYPKPEDLNKKLEWIRDLGPETTSIYERLWLQLKGE